MLSLAGDCSPGLALAAGGAFTMLPFDMNVVELSHISGALARQRESSHAYRHPCDQEGS